MKRNLLRVNEAVLFHILCELTFSQVTASSLYGGKHESQLVLRTIL